MFKVCSQVDWCFKTRRPYLYTGIRFLLSYECPLIDTKVSDGQALFLKLIEL